MVTFRTNLPAMRVHESLQAALVGLHKAERNVALWFSEIAGRRLYTELGYGSMLQYAQEGLGFSRAKAYAFVRLAERMKDLPQLRESVATGDISWTKAREVAKVATPQTENVWVEAAKANGRRELERRVAQVRSRARQSRTHQGQTGLKLSADGTSGVAGPSQNPAPGLGLGMGMGMGMGLGMGLGLGLKLESELGLEPECAVPANETRELPSGPVRVGWELSPLLHARYEALRERIRKLGYRDGPAELLVQALEDMAARLEAEVAEKRDAALCHASPHQALSARTRTTDGLSPEMASTGGLSPKAASAVDVPPMGSVVRKPTSAKASPLRGQRGEPRYQVHIHVCPRCQAGSAVSGGRNRALPPSVLQAALCDARIAAPGERNRATVAPGRRREVLDRDGHRCRVKGCGRARFIEVHHLRPREAKGSNSADNLVTLCSGCHRALHERGWERMPFREVSRDAEWAAGV